VLCDVTAEMERAGVCCTLGALGLLVKCFFGLHVLFPIFLRGPDAGF
jgi:hypothetical protein